jgi:hypothetical protein
MQHIVEQSLEETTHPPNQAFSFRRAVSYTFATRIWSGFAGVATIWFVGRSLSKVDQGYFYTFASVLSLQVFFELGLGYVLMQCASHEFAGGLGRDAVTSPLRNDSGRVGRLLKQSLVWYGWLAGCFVATAFPVGLWFFHVRGVEASPAHWQMAWALALVAVAAQLTTTPILAVLEGSGQVSEVAAVRLLQGLAANLVLWFCLIYGAGLLSIGLSIGAGVAAIGLALLTRHRTFIQQLWVAAREARPLEWRREIWPFQWRIGVSWLSGYFVNQLFTPATFAYLGPVAAGQVGMSLAAVNLISSAGSPWLTVRAPALGQLAAQRRLEDMDKILKRGAVRSMQFGIAAAVILIATTSILHMIGNQVAERFLPIQPLSFLSITALLNLIVNAEATYLRAFRREPFLLVSILTGASVGTSTIISARMGSIQAMTLSFLLLTATVTLGTATITYNRERRKLFSGRVRCS